MKKKRYVLVDEQDSKRMILHVAFRGVDNDDQVLCDLSESSVIELVKKIDILPYDLNIDADVVNYITASYLE